MTSGELKELLALMREFGVTRYKAKGIDLRLELRPGDIVNPLNLPKEPLKYVSRETTQAPISESEASPTEEITHKVVEMTSLLKLSDQELVDRLFPDHTQDEAEAS